MEIQKIMKQISMLKLLPNEIMGYEKLEGGTASRVYLASDSANAKYVIKLNESAIIKAEVYFLKNYQHLSLLPDPLFADDTGSYFVQSFISGSGKYNGRKAEMLTILVKELINHYSPLSDKSSWGWIEEPVNSWQTFLLQEAAYAQEILKPYMGEGEYHFLLKRITHPKRKYKDIRPYLLHGDCGVHNFIFQNGNLKGVIDPSPIIGDPLYDLVYAFCSSPDHLTKETINEAFDFLKLQENISKQALYEEVLIGLFFRLATCLKHHPEDIHTYLNAWNTWKTWI